MPVRPQQRGVLTDRIDDLRVDFGNEDPVLAARRGVAALAPYGGGTIVLVTDATFDCTQPPEGWCQAVADVVPEGYAVMPIGCNTYDQELLDCLAQKTGGTVTLTEDAEALADAIVDASELRHPYRQEARHDQHDHSHRQEPADRLGSELARGCDRPRLRGDRGRGIRDEPGTTVVVPVVDHTVTATLEPAVDVTIRDLVVTTVTVEIVLEGITLASHRTALSLSELSRPLAPSMADAS